MKTITQNQSIYKINFWMLPIEPQQGLKGQEKVYIDLYSSELESDDIGDADDFLGKDLRVRGIMDKFDWGYNLRFCAAIINLKHIKFLISLALD